MPSPFLLDFTLHEIKAIINSSLFLVHGKFYYYVNKRFPGLCKMIRRCGGAGEIQRCPAGAAGGGPNDWISRSVAA